MRRNNLNSRNTKHSSNTSNTSTTNTNNVANKSYIFFQTYIIPPYVGSTIMY